MTEFVLIAALMVVVVTAWLVYPLARARPMALIDRSEAAAAALRVRGNELATDVASGALPADCMGEARRELQRRAADECFPAASHIAAATTSPRLCATLSAVLPVAAVLLYMTVGTPEALVDGAFDRPSALEPVDQQVQRLTQRLKEQPGDAEGWAMLGRAEVASGRYERAAEAFLRATALSPGKAEWLVDHADALAMTQGGRLDGEPAKLLQRALVINPDEPRALALAGADAYARKDYTRALGYWERLLETMPAESPLARSVAAGVQASRAALGSKPPVATAGTGRVSGIVMLGSEHAVRAGDTLFIFVRAADGPAMPLAVIKRRADELPVEFLLDDSQAMTPQLKLSQFDRLQVGARVSRSGSPVAAAGDIEGWSDVVRPGQTGLRITLSRVVP